MELYHRCQNKFFLAAIFCLTLVMSNIQQQEPNILKLVVVSFKTSNNGEISLAIWPEMAILAPLVTLEWVMPVWLERSTMTDRYSLCIESLKLENYDESMDQRDLTMVCSLSIVRSTAELSSRRTCGGGQRREKLWNIDSNFLNS